MFRDIRSKSPRIELLHSYGKKAGIKNLAIHDLQNRLEERNEGVKDIVPASLQAR